MVNCCILGCKKRSDQKCGNVTFHRFPSEQVLRNQWVKATGRPGWQPSKFSKLCSIHFEKDVIICMNLKTYLKPDAVPKKYIHGTPTVGPSTSQSRTPTKRKMKTNFEQYENVEDGPMHDCEIEFLDEDAEVVQQCVLTTSQDEISVHDDRFKTIPLLVERHIPSQEKSVRRRKRRKREDDEDYDPTKDEVSGRKRRKSIGMPKIVKRFKMNAKEPPKQGVVLPRVKNYYGKDVQLQRSKSPREELNYKPRDPICIPDYENPLCLAVDVVNRHAQNMDNVKIWNKQCIEMYRTRDKPLLPKSEDNDIKSCSRHTIVIRNVKNKIAGNINTTLWNKVITENSSGEKKSMLFQGIMPIFSDKQKLNFNMYEPTKKSGVRTVNSVLLTKEDYKNVQGLVAYKPERAVSTVYKLVQKSKPEGGVMKREKYLEEQASCKVCAYCYQYSWRGVNGDSAKRDVSCEICGRVFVNTYNMLSHLKSHSRSEIKRYRRQISMSLAKTVGYHYKCRICQISFASIKELRHHIGKHQGKTPFRCSVGNHMAR